MDKEKLYLKSPYFIQSLLINLEGFFTEKRRYNSNFWNNFRKLSIKSRDEIEQVDKIALREFLFSANETRFWSQRFKEFGVNLDEHDICSELNKLPILSKKEVKENINDIFNNNVKDKIKFAHTGGTTGSGLVFPQTISSENAQWAVWWRYRLWHGIDKTTWMGWFGGRSILNLAKKDLPFWHINYPMKQVMFSSHHLNQSNADFYFGEMVKRKLTWLHGYPSQLFLLAKYLEKSNFREQLKIKLITVGAENLLEYQKHKIEEAFNAPVRQHYGMAEGVSNISEYIDGSFVVDQDFAFTEFIPLMGEEGLYQIIGTNYHNKAFPLIRYDTGDIASIDCGNDNKSLKVLSIDGRMEDYIILPNGIKLGRLDHIFKDQIHIEEAQIIQNEDHSITIKVVKGKLFDQTTHEADLIMECQKRFGKDVSLLIEYVEKIPRTKANKIRLVISKVKQ